MRYLLDSNILIDGIRKFTTAVSFLDKERDYGICVLTCYELIEGVQSKRGLSLVMGLLDNLEKLYVNDKVQDTCLELMIKYRFDIGLKIADALIAATAITYALPLYTCNIKHFKGIKGLRVYKPY